MSATWIRHGVTTRVAEALAKARATSPLLVALIFCVGCLIFVNAYGRQAAEARERWENIRGLMADQLAKVTQLRAIRGAKIRAGVVAAGPTLHTIDELLAGNRLLPTQRERDALLVAADLDAIERDLRREAADLHLDLQP